MQIRLNLNSHEPFHSKFCISFVLHLAIIGLENQFSAFLRNAVLHRFYCSFVALTLIMLDNFVTSFLPSFIQITCRIPNDDIFTSSVETSVYPDRLASEEPTGMDLHTPLKNKTK